NYGSGKSHLLRFIRETALKEGFAISSVTLDAKSGVRFNRMDQILGAIWRGLEIPSASGSKGVRPFFDFVCEQARSSKGATGGQWEKITNKGKWDFSQVLDSPANFIALRACFSGRCNKDIVEDWLFQTGKYTTTQIFQELVHKTRMCFRHELALTSTFKWHSYTTNSIIFNFKYDAYAQCWSTLRDINILACAAGLKGLIILFDEFEDVLSNITNIEHQKTAFQNLFQFFAGVQFQGMSFFAVTPDFVDKCKQRLLNRGYWDYDYSPFDTLPTFEMSPVEESNLQELARKIKEMHSIAYCWDTNLASIESGLKSVVKKSASIAVQDRTRQTIKAVIQFLDGELEENE
ncbi:MAG: BREX system ATP-binding domain-containing protein, partial [Hassallia sp.]